MTEFTDLKVAVIATDGFEESELIDPLMALKDAGAHVDILSPKLGTLQAFRHMDKGTTVKVNRRLDDASPDEYDALILPGGTLNADALRMLPKAQAFVRAFQEASKPIAAICHGPWLLVSADLVRGRKLTSYHTIQDDIRNAGGQWVDQEVVEDDNLITSRQPSDLPAFIKAISRLFTQQPTAARG